MKRGGLVLLASLAMGALLLVELHLLSDWLVPAAGLHRQLAALAFLVASAMAVYFACTVLFGAVDRSMLMKLAKGRRGRAKAAE